ncbi:Serine/threonine-protein kinase PRR1 [Ceratocystis lukuohia]|uniref:Serine/threonine-protein kinase PRR1 n=1 Tax=Ceratocystis lukuohia TaxID=2019550 RepID=A0ABR4MUA4_9PEZI
MDSHPATTRPQKSNTTASLCPSSPGSDSVSKMTSCVASNEHDDHDKNFIPIRPQPVQFRSNTIAPSPTLPQAEFTTSPTSPVLSTSAPRSPSQLRLVTDTHGVTHQSPRSTDNIHSNPGSLRINTKKSTTTLRSIARTPSLKASITRPFSGPSGSSPASSFAASPVIAAMGDVTPLPSPLLYHDSSGPWSAISGRPSSGDVLPIPRSDAVLVSAEGESIDTALANSERRKSYAALAMGRDSLNVAQNPANVKEHHTRNRSLSEFTPDPVAIPKRMVTVSGPHGREAKDASKRHMRRETNFAESRGLTPTCEQPPTPPSSETSKSSIDGAIDEKAKGPAAEYFEAYGRIDGKKRRWRAVKTLGQGTFSRVVLGTSQIDIDDATLLLMDSNTVEVRLDRKTLVAIKVCEHGPRGGASEDRIEMSLKRELEIMKMTRHPSLVNLKAFNLEMTRAILVLTHCPGGDLFDVATTNHNALKPALLRRIFSEIVGAVQYLHQNCIVHRDIKLENVLVNLRPSELANPGINWKTYPYSVITVTDLGLSRQITDDEKLETRCGSEDYAAPEVIMGQPYDGRATDAWSLGVLLYALIEARLPFDPHPGVSDFHRMRSRTSHRIARVEWRWVKYEGEDGDHEGSIAKFTELDMLGAMEITEGLLKRARSRWTLQQVADNPWVKDALQIPGGLQYREELEGQEV